MDSRHPSHLIDRHALAAHRTALVPLSELINRLEDYELTMRRARQPVDVDGAMAEYEPHRQRERSLHDELAKLRGTYDRLQLILRNYDDDIVRLLAAEAEERKKAAEAAANPAPIVS